MVLSGNDGSMPDGWYASGTPKTEKSDLLCGGELCGGFSKLGFTQCDGSSAVCIKRLYSESDRRPV